MPWRCLSRRIHLRDIAFALRSRLSNIAIVLGTKAEGKVNLAVVLGDDVVARGLNASQIVREAAKAIQGGGGGQPFFAMAGGKKPEGLAEAMDVALRLIHDSSQNKRRAGNVSQSTFYCKNKRNLWNTIRYC